MVAGALAGCLRDKSVLITGSTGFLGKLFVEKILRVQPAVKKIYLLVRASHGASAEQRVMSEVTGEAVFDIQREKYGPVGFQNFIKEKVVPIDGDIMHDNLGLDSAQVSVLTKEVDAIINAAATTNFYERYDVALNSNALGAKNVCEFGKKCCNMKLLLHVSTAFVAGTQEGLMLERAFHNGETLREGYYLDIEEELQLVRNVKTELMEALSDSSEKLEKSKMKELGLKRACHFGWPNVYTFTKAMGEILLGQYKGELPIVIIRPTMVTSTYQDPFPGWIEGTRTIDALIVDYDEQALPCFLGDRNDIIDLIPADMVINAALVAMVVHWNEKLQVIYHVSSSCQNPLSVNDFVDSCFDYFSITPRILNGRVLQTRRPYLFKRYVFFRVCLMIIFSLPLMILEGFNMLLCGCFSRYFNDLNRRYNFLILLVKLYAPYAFFKGRFDDSNLTWLRMETKICNVDGGNLNFDPKQISWHSYLISVHVPAVLKYAHMKNRTTLRRTSYSYSQ
ncbi:hypothetical protein ACQJBY_061874 [Aegilops geniculata]